MELGPKDRIRCDPSLGVTSFPPARLAGGCPDEEALMCLLEHVTTYTGSL